MPGCSVKRCGNNSSNRVKDPNGNIVTFHQFPANELRKNDWIARIRDAGKTTKDGSPWAPNHNAKVCSVHFEERYIERGSNQGRSITRLAADAVPTKFPHIPSNKNYSQKPREIQPAVTVEPLFEEKENEQFLLQNEIPADHDLSNILVQAIENADIMITDNPEGVLAADGNFVDLPLTVVNLDDNALTNELGSEQRSHKVVTLPNDYGMYCSLTGPTATPVPSEEAAASYASGYNTPPTSRVTKISAQPFSPGEDKASSSAEKEDEDDGACCKQYLDDSGNKDGKSLAYDFRDALETLQRVQSQLLHKISPQQLQKLGSLLEQLSIEGKSIFQSLAFITLQVGELKRVRIPTQQEETTEPAETERQRRRVDDMDELLNAELENALSHVEEADFSAMMTASDFDVLLALSHDVEVGNLEQNFSQLNQK